MGLEVQRVAYGGPAVSLLAEQVARAKDGDTLRPVTVVVPSNYAAVATRRELALGGIAAVSFLTLSRLAERLAGATLAAAGRRPASAPVIVHAVRAALAEAPGVLAGVADHPATELALASAQRELAGLEPQALDRLAAQSTRAADVVRIARTVTDRLSGQWHDEHDLLVVASEAVRTSVPAWLGPVILHLPQQLPPAGGALVRALARHGHLAVNVGATGVELADSAVVASLERSGVAVPPAVGIDRPRATRVVSVSDPDDEVRAAVRLVVQGVRDGVSLGRMALLFGAANPYARLLREHLDAAGIPANGTPVGALGEMLAGRVVRGVLALPERSFRRSDVFAVLSSTRMVDEDGRWVPVRAWERVSRAAGVVDDDDWDHRLATFADDQRRRATIVEGEGRLGLAQGLRADAERAGALAAFVARLVTDVEAGHSATSWSAMAEWASGLLDRYVGDDRSGWPQAEREAADRVGGAIERLGALDALGGPPPTVEQFHRTLDGELDTALQRIGRLGEGVLVGPLSLAVGLRLDRVVILGLAEGTFPDRRLEDSLLPDRERAVTDGTLALRAEHVDDDHRSLLTAMAAGPATLCFPRGDLRQPGDRTASRWLLDDASALAGSTTRLTTDDLVARRGFAWLDVVPSFTAGIARLSFPATRQEHTLASLLSRDGPLSERPLVSADSVLEAGVALAEARRSAAFTRFDGNLTGLRLPAVADGGVALSATRLQAWAVCPHAYLLEHVLGVQVVEEPERRLRLDALDLGSLIHAVLHRFVEEDSTDPERLRALAEEVCNEFAARGRAGRQVYWRRDRSRILTDLDRFLTDDLAWRAESGAAPLGTEHRFDAVIPLPTGGGLRVRGAIDRVDRLPDGGLVVFDYKTGRSTSYAGLGEDDPHQGGTRLQPVLYGVGARRALGGGALPVRFEYWFVTERGSFDRCGYDITDEVMADVGEALVTITDGIGRGLFPLRPPAVPGWNRVDCWFCAPDGLSAAEARRDWERKRSDPLLAAYLGLCEPEDDSGAD